MSVVDQNAIDLAPRISEAEVGDYIALLKPRVMSLVVFTALVGLMIAPLPVHPVLAFTAILCIAVGAGASGALNMAYEGDIDALMTRTANRPIPRGRITQGEAAAFGLTLAFFSVITLGILVIMSMGSWYIIITKVYEQFRMMKHARNAEKSCVPSNWRAAASIATTSSGRWYQPANPASSAGRSARTSSRYE